MATFTMSIPDAIVPVLLNAFDWQYPGRVVVDEDGNPVETCTKADWAKLQLRRHIKEIYKSYKVVTDMDAARDAAALEAETETAGVAVT